MLRTLRRLFNRFLNKSRTINHEPLNKVSLIVIILIDIFILFQVFAGLDDISRWHLSPTEVYPCYAEWQDYRTQASKDKDYNLIKNILTNNPIPQSSYIPPLASYPPNPPEPQSSFRKSYQQVEAGHLGQVSSTCLNYADLKDKINVKANQQSLKTIEQKQSKINQLEQKNSQIRAQYDSTLLEKIAGQSRDRSINATAAEQAKESIAQNERSIANLKKEIQDLKNELLARVQKLGFFQTLQSDNPFSQLKKEYNQSSFWYPSIQLGLQALFLLPLLLLAYLIHSFALRRSYGLIALISWHLLVIFSIPLIIKVFEFLQIGVIFKFIFDIVSKLLGGLLFLVSYVYIFLIPLIGFGIIKFFQRFVFNPKVQAANRIQKSRCARCAKQLRNQDSYCPYCGYYQYRECSNCHNLTYKHLSYCKECGHTQDILSE